LNPRLQAGLADLVVALSKRGIGLIIESHSEHFLLRIRRLLAEDSIAAEDVGLHFVERDRATSLVREVPLDQNGYIDPESWPREFFDDSLRESLALAAAQASRSSSKTRNS
jgi:predicted ATPase